MTGSDSNQPDIREKFKVSENPRDLKIVEVEWLDSYGIHGWGDRDDRVKEMNESFGLNLSVGYVVSDTPEWLVVTESISHRNNVGCCMSIPRVAIKSVTVIREGPEA